MKWNVAHDNAVHVQCTIFTQGTIKHCNTVPWEKQPGHEDMQDTHTHTYVHMYVAANTMWGWLLFHNCYYLSEGGHHVRDLHQPSAWDTSRAWPPVSTCLGTCTAWDKQEWLTLTADWWMHVIPTLSHACTYTHTHAYSMHTQSRPSTYVHTYIYQGMTLYTLEIYTNSRQKNHTWSDVRTHLLAGICVRKFKTSLPRHSGHYCDTAHTASFTHYSST